VYKKRAKIDRRKVKEKRQAMVEARDPQHFANLQPRMETPDLKKLVAKVWNSDELANAATYCVEDENACVYVSCIILGRSLLVKKILQYATLEAVVALTKGNTRLRKMDDMTTGPLASLLKKMQVGPLSQCRL
jgi:hypothetical protein